ncbi:MAG TPA: proline/glycine betaine ABC transporter permease, partial [Aestuariivirga sp.]|nr:proline/glycine betaine ABC transporter permease [Aestuariivirga sp.]
MEWLTKFPHLGDETLRALKLAIDEGFRGFTRGYGDTIEAIFDPLKFFLIKSEQLMLATPWPIMLAVMGLIAWLASRNWRIVAGTIATL